MGSGFLPVNANLFDGSSNPIASTNGNIDVEIANDGVAQLLLQVVNLMQTLVALQQQTVVLLSASSTGSLDDLDDIPSTFLVS